MFQETILFVFNFNGFTDHANISTHKLFNHINFLHFFARKKVWSNIVFTLFYIYGALVFITQYHTNVLFSMSFYILSNSRITCWYFNLLWCDENYGIFFSSHMWIMFFWIDIRKLHIDDNNLLNLFVWVFEKKKTLSN